MSTKARAGQRHPTARRTGPPLFPIAVTVVVVLLLAVLVISAIGGDDTSTPSADGGDDDVAQTRAVTVAGTPLLQYGSQPIDEDDAVGVEAPTISGEDFDGDPVAIEADGRPKAVAFLAHWCGHCRAEVPRLAAWLDDHDVPDAIDLVLVPTSTSSAQPNYPPSAWLADAGLGDVPTLVDDDRSAAHVAFGGGGFPYWVLLDADHRVVARMSGEFPDDPDVYTTMFDALAAGDPITDPRT
ncbi:MAG TPA: TlpA disulfide reductase family protein [Acidimicrobiia bacterium]|nr:TlpA disulfide reductase family protein [Acidimicrobiia bacterium]